MSSVVVVTFIALQPPKLRLVDFDILPRHRHHLIVVLSFWIAFVKHGPAERVEDPDDFFFGLEVLDTARMEDGVSGIGEFQTCLKGILAAMAVKKDNFPPAIWVDQRRLIQAAKLLIFVGSSATTEKSVAAGSFSSCVMVGSLNE